MKVTTLPKSERPRERLIAFGARHLNNEDLLAIILKNGTKKMPVKDLAIEILKRFKEIHRLKEMNYEQLIQIPGIGPAQACNLLAVIELGKRIYQTVPSLQSTNFGCAEDIYKYYKDRIGDAKQEHFYCVYLDQKKAIIRDKKLFVGTVNQSLIHPREIFKEAYLLSATSIICIHNHPSGNLEPSTADQNMTDSLCKVGRLLGIDVVDHIIIGKAGYYSFYESGRI